MSLAAVADPTPIRLDSDGIRQEVEARPETQALRATLLDRKTRHR